MKKLFTLAQITDPHVGRIITFPSGKIDLFDELVRTADKLAAFSPRPDALVVSGDLAHHGGEEDYRRARAVLDGLAIPYYLVVGNHDRRALLREVFCDQAWLGQSGEEFIQYAIEDYPVRLIVLDTLAPESHRGCLDAPRIRWLEARLAEQPRRPTLIFLHHPPFETGMPYPDSLGLDGKEALGEVVARYGNIEAVASGHTHRDSIVRWKGTLACVTPGCSFSYKLEFGDVDDLDPLDNPPAFRIFRWDPEIGLVSHLCYTREYEFGLSEGVPAPPEQG
jgi:Icc protein